jgi:hypothetical protein
MRVISLWQPWAELVARGLKLYETRSWAIEYRGEIAIHAAKKKYNPLAYPQEFRAQQLQDGVDSYWLKYGAVLCVVDVVDCLKTEDVRASLSARELLYGDYSTGRFAWKLDNIHVFPQPIALDGHQGIFHWKDGERLLQELAS